MSTTLIVCYSYVMCAWSNLRIVKKQILHYRQRSGDTSTRTVWGGWEEPAERQRWGFLYKERGCPFLQKTFWHVTSGKGCVNNKMNNGWIVIVCIGSLLHSDGFRGHLNQTHLMSLPVFRLQVRIPAVKMLVVLFCLIFIFFARCFIRIMFTK